MPNGVGTPAGLRTPPLQTSTHLDEVDLDPNGIGGTVDTNLKTARLDPKGLVVIVR